ncbi:MAG: hypothetical protein Q7U99_02430 [Rubrivivax sp.]|nr:hypothetical protein [Rubrivivax sp.]MDP3222784.1 hypothetical protein [Rubrivivax sp.]
MTVHAVGTPDLTDPVQAAQRRTVGGRVKMLVVLLVCAAPVIASYFTYFVIRPEGRTNYSTLILPTRALPDLALRTLDGQNTSAAALKGQWLLVAVGPAACDAACEKRLFLQRQLREMLGRDRDRLDKVWFITDEVALAPELRLATQDSPVPVTTLRVPPEQLAAWLAPAEGQSIEAHLYLVDPMGEWMMRVPADAEPGRVKRDLERVMRGSAGWDKAGR